MSHWQLRHYISSPEKDSLYYASGNEVYHLNTATRKRKHLTTLPFEARCTASGNGYVCVGGEDEGHFAIIKLETSRTARQIDIDDPLPIEEYWQTPAAAPRAANIQVERIGDEIVNSISIHQVHDEEAHLYDVVAVLTNNDRTVRVYSLQHGVETACLDLPFPMNHASLSPDGRTLVAVGDSNQAFFYARVIQEARPQIPKPHNRLNMSAATWVIASLVHLRAEPQSRDPSHAPGYFTTAWSPSGHLVAVGSEGGHISVFDIQLLKEGAEEEGEDAIVATVPSTRPNLAAHLHPGAVRTIIFSPEPWDLLIWAEDQGRVCIGDLRTGLRTKQVIDLKPDEEGLRKIDMEDIPNDNSTLEEQSRLLELEEAFLRQHRDTPNTATASNFASEFFQARERLRQQQQQAIHRDFPSLVDTAALQDDPRGLTAREQQILDGLRTTRQREEARAEGTLPRSVNYTSPALFSSRNRPSSEAPPTDNRPFSDVLVNHNEPYAAFPELSRTSQRNQSSTRESDRLGSDNTLPPLHSIQEYLRLRDRQRETSSPSNERRRSIPPHATRVTIPSNSTPEPEEDNPWRTISNAMSLARGPLFESPRSTEPTTTSSRTARVQEAVNRTEQLRRIAAQRDRLRSIRRDIDGGTIDAAQNLYESLTALRGFTRPGATNSFNDYAEVLLTRRTAREVNIGVRTAGLAMSHDGRTLFAACEEGIFEIGINVKSRMAFPAIEMR